jgi:hypothetical protein
MNIVFVTKAFCPIDFPEGFFVPVPSQIPNRSTDFRAERRAPSPLIARDDRLTGVGSLRHSLTLCHGQAQIPSVDAATQRRSETQVN